MSTLGCLDFKLLFTEGYIVAGSFDLSLMYFSFFHHPIPMNVLEFWELQGLYSLLQFWARSATGDGINFTRTFLFELTEFYPWFCAPFGSIFFTFCSLDLMTMSVGCVGWMLKWEPFPV